MKNKENLSEAPLKLKRKLTQRSLGSKQGMLALALFISLSTLLLINILPPYYLMKSPSFRQLVSTSFLVIGIIAIMGFYLAYYKPKVFKKPSLLLLLGIILLAITVIAKVFALLTTIHASFWGFLIPVAFVGMVIGVLFDTQLALMMIIFSSILVGFLTQNNFSYTAVALLGGLVAIFSVSRLSQRHELTRAGLLVGLILAFFSFAIGLTTRSLQTALIDGVVGFINGIFSAVLALGTLPFLESQFGILTTMKLLELSNPNQPLLRQLMLQAPGTYNHSIAVGNLAESAAEAVGANSLLVRVGAYYHDIGKMKRPSFFVENQTKAVDRHQKINPHLSCLVITSHVKEGMDMAQGHKLPKEIIDLISQHHGTGVVKYFYHQAKKNVLKEAVCEENFRYSGEKPHSKEAAILMLADAAEAAAKTLPNPTATKLEQLIRELIGERLSDGQLDECELTLADLDKIAKSFSQTLMGIYHPRVDYPKEKSKKEKDSQRSSIFSQVKIK